jgi:hypothetical protein
MKRGGSDDPFESANAGDLVIEVSNRVIPLPRRLYASTPWTMSRLPDGQCSTVMLRRPYICAIELHTCLAFSSLPASWAHSLSPVDHAPFVQPEIPLLL